MISATAHADSHVIEISFDATDFFRTADIEDVLALIDCDFGGDYAADQVALHFEESAGHEVKRMMEHVVAASEGFECHVNGEEMLAWLKENRSDLYQAVCAKAHLIP